MPAPTPAETAELMDRYLENYWNTLQASRLADKSVEDYYYFAMCFVRWINGSFTPGENIK
jgi:hypothetical protein